jgi:ABC-type amino acid transport substrate-binding protein
MKLRMMILFILVSNFCFAQENTINVGISNFYPIVITDNISEPTGFEIDLINYITKELNIKPIYQEIPFSNIFDDLLIGKVDMIAAGISVNYDREEKIDFSQPTFNSGLMLAHKKLKLNPLNRIRSIIKDPRIINIFKSFILFLIITSIILWVSELGNNQISDHPIKGILEAFWCINCTITTVGYGDIAAKNIFGRIVTLIVMYSGISFFALFVGVISSSFSEGYNSSNLYDIKKLEDLRNSSRTVGVISNTISHKEALKISKNVLIYSTETELLDAVLKEKCDVILHDYTWIKSSMVNNPDIEMIGEQFLRHHYGFGFSSIDTDLKNKFNLELLKMRENGEYETIYKKWFN